MIGGKGFHGTINSNKEPYFYEQVLAIEQAEEKKADCK